LYHLQVSISTLFAFWIVALALMWKRYYTPGSNGKNAMMAGQLLLMVGAALSELCSVVIHAAAAAVVDITVFAVFWWEGVKLAWHCVIWQ
jgi:hypothetical protein